MLKAFRVGITGGIGSGKTSVCRIFAILGIPVFSADNEARRIMESDTGLRNEINAVAGKDLYENGTLDRPALAAIIFNDRTKLGQVNSLVHPLVYKSFEEWNLMQDSPYTLLEAAILFESGGDRHVDRTISVVAPESERIERVIRRNNLTRQEVIERMRNQIDDARRAELSDYVIGNSENAMILPEVLKIHDDLLSLALNRKHL